MAEPVRAADVAEMVLAQIIQAGNAGISLQELVERTGLRYRVLHNVTWTLEGSPEPSTSSPDYGIPRHPDQIRAQRMNTGDHSVRYIAVVASPDGQPATPEEASNEPPSEFLLNAAGDIYARRFPDGSTEVVDPDDWGWAGPDHHVPPEGRYTIDELTMLPGFSLTIAPDLSFTPGPKRRSGTWMQWANGLAPPAHYSGKRGASGHFNRLSEVLGYTAASLPRNPESSPYQVHDFVQGRRIEIHYSAPDVGPSGDGLVYILDDGFALKFGHTTRAPAIRVNELQTGNPRTLRTIVTVAPASEAVESHLQGQLGAYFVRGEWYQREPILTAVSDAGGWTTYLQGLLPHGTWDIITYQP